MSEVKNILGKLHHFASLITVEPIGFFNFLAFHILLLTLQTGLYDVICYQQFHTNHTINCKNLKKFKDAEDEVQQLASWWNMIFSLAHFLPAIMAHILLGAWSDKSGRKVNILIGLIGLMINIFPLTIIFTYKNTSIWYLALSSFISGATGYLGIITTSSFAYLSDVIENRKNLTFRMVNYAISIAVAAVLGAFFASLLLKIPNMAYVPLFMEIVLAIAFFYGLIRLQQIPPAEMKLRSKTLHSVENGVTNGCNTKQPVLKQKLTFSQELCVVMTNSGVLLKAVWRTYTRQREGKRRAYIMLISLVYFLHLFSEMGLRGNVTSLYVFRRPIEWTGPKLAYWKTAHNLLILIGNIFGIIIFKKMLKFNETTIILISLASGFAELLVTGLCKTTWMMYLAAALGMFSQLVIPTVKSFTSMMVNPDEVGKSYTAFGLAADFGYGVSNMAANGIYFSSLKFFPGFVFILGSLMIAVSFTIMLWIHIDFKRERHLTATDTRIQNIPVVVDLENSAKQLDDTVV